MPRNHEPPTAMQNKHGELLTNKDDIINEAVEHYKNVFKENEIDQEHEEHKIERENICKTRLQETKLNKTQKFEKRKI